MKILRRTLYFFVLVSILCFCGCRNKMGYFLVTWSEPNTGVETSEIYPIKSESHLRKTYIIKIDKKKFVEIPTFRGFIFNTIAEAEKEREKILPFKNSFCYVERKTPVREAPDELSARIYILCENQVIKVIGKGKEKVKIGDRFEGYWYKIVTDDGIIGYCFDKNITFYEDDGKGKTTRVNDVDVFAEIFFGNKWYPLEYKDVMAESYPDLRHLRSGRCLWGDAASHEVFLYDGEKEIKFNFSTIKQVARDRIVFTGSTLDLSFYPDGKIYVRFSDSGIDKSEFFVVLDEPLEEYLCVRNEAKEMQYKKIYADVLYFNSYENGCLKFTPDMTFTWTERYGITEDFIPAVNGDRGVVSNDKYSIERLKKNCGYDGVITMTFSQTAKEMNFIHKRLPNGELQLIYVPEDAFSGILLKQVPENSRVFEFTPVTEAED